MPFVRFRVRSNASALPHNAVPQGSLDALVPKLRLGTVSFCRNSVSATLSLILAQLRHLEAESF